MILELVNNTPFMNQVVLIATAQSGKSLHPKLNHLESSHFFTCELRIPPLTQDSRLEIIQAVLQNKGLDIERNVDYNSVTSRMDGYVAVDIEHVIDKAAHLAVSDSGLFRLVNYCYFDSKKIKFVIHSLGSVQGILIHSNNLEDAMENHIPFGLYGINLKPPTDSRIAWSDVGGLAQAKRMLLETLKWPTQVCKFTEVPSSIITLLSPTFPSLSAVPAIILPLPHSTTFGSTSVRSSGNGQDNDRQGRGH